MTLVSLSLALLAVQVRWERLAQQEDLVWESQERPDCRADLGHKEQTESLVLLEQLALAERQGQLD